MAIKNLSEYDVTKYRSIVFHGKHAMRDMNLMMIGSTPLSDLSPKIVREEVAYADGDLDLSRVDNVTYFNSRTITYTFVLVDEEQATDKPVYRNRTLTNQLSAIYKWLYQDYVDYQLTAADMYNIDSQLQIGYVLSNEMYDYGYGAYKFTNATVTETKVSKAMFNNAWVETLEVTFTFDPYMQTFYGNRIELATFVDRSITSRNVQTAMYVYTNNRYFLNDFEQWFNTGTLVSGKTWRFRIRIPYRGTIGFRLAPNPTMDGVTYVVTAATGQSTPLYFLDNSHPGETITTHAGGYGYTTPIQDSNGYSIIDFTVTFEDTYTVENKPWICFDWGVLRSYTVPDQTHYIVDAYSKTNSASMYIGDTEGGYHTEQFSTAFTLPTRPLNEIHIRNTEYDGMYKFRYDSTNRRL